ncbi:ABC transporter ATP-binding protein [Longimonas halophila]|uniref:ABC transporter ATP-binding protein n=1 Tax=Longimonas halophila TaxID=1469170 RepID=A0A2H3P4K8_9BACT|nr:glycine betaine/L-proline ABC transporter ATP-binding protein [Longimonas halophila]PEN09449.1 ABC transporter ATP-binding protein [Longimonas halophila]
MPDSDTPAANTPAAIEVRNLYKVFGDATDEALDMLRNGHSNEEILEQTDCTVAVNDASFTVNEGEIFVLMGLSGSGKSTLLRCMNRLVEPTKGEVLVDGDDITQMNGAELRALCEKVSMVFQHFGLLPHRTTQSNVEFGLEVRGVDQETRSKRAKEAIDLVGLSGYEDHTPDTLSGGMQQRVGLARALANDPSILLMDEPFSALDPLIRSEMQNELLNLQQEMQETIVFVTHDLDEALKIGDRVAIMKSGRVVQIGTPEEILTEPADEYVRSFVQDVDRTRVIQASTLMRSYPTVHLAEATSEEQPHGPAVAIRKMRSEGTPLVYAVDADQRLLGVVHLDDAVDLRTQDRSDLHEALTRDVPTAHENTPVAALLPVVFEADLPVAILNDDDELVGVVDRASILSEVTTNIENLMESGALNKDATPEKAHVSRTLDGEASAPAAESA